MPNRPVKDFSLPSTGGAAFKLSDQRGSKLVLYFYPNDDTPGCGFGAQSYLLGLRAAAELAARPPGR